MPHRGFETYKTREHHISARSVQNSECRIEALRLYLLPEGSSATLLVQNSECRIEALRPGDLVNDDRGFYKFRIVNAA